MPECRNRGNDEGLAPAGPGYAAARWSYHGPHATGATMPVLSTTADPEGAHRWRKKPSPGPETSWTASCCWTFWPARRSTSSGCAGRWPSSRCSPTPSSCGWLAVARGRGGVPRRGVGARPHPCRRRHPHPPGHGVRARDRRARRRGRPGPVGTVGRRWHPVRQRRRAASALLDAERAAPAPASAPASTVPRGGRRRRRTSAPWSC